jgi:hypothetical protein
MNPSILRSIQSMGSTLRSLTLGTRLSACALRHLHFLTHLDCEGFANENAVAALSLLTTLRLLHDRSGELSSSSQLHRLPSSITSIRDVADHICTEDMGWWH